MRRQDLPYPNAAERLARVEERIDNLIDRIDRMARTMRFAIGTAIGITAAVIPLVVVVVH